MLLQVSSLFARFMKSDVVIVTNSAWKRRLGNEGKKQTSPESRRFSNKNSRRTAVSLHKGNCT